MEERKLAYRYLYYLGRNRLWVSRVYKMISGEFDRDLLTADSRLGLALDKATPYIKALWASGRSRVRKQEAKDAIMVSKVKVR